MKDVRLNEFLYHIHNQPLRQTRKSPPFYNQRKSEHISLKISANASESGSQSAAAAAGEEKTQEVVVSLAFWNRRMEKCCCRRDKIA